MPAAIVMSSTPSAGAATVLAVEGTLQLSRTTQKAFGGEFCRQNTCRSINNARTPFDVKPASRQLQAAVDATPGPIMLMGYSLGAASIYDRMREWERNPGLAPDRDRLVLVVTFGNPENKFGGDKGRNSHVGVPDGEPYQHLDVTMQYDSVADRPTRWGWYSTMNAAFARHTDYFQPSDINDPDNLIYRDPDGSTYMLIKADVLPMLKWRAWFTSDERMAELDAQYRPLIEADYDRPDYVGQGEGADWGNGNPPPSVTDAADDARRTFDGPGSDEVAFAAEEQPENRTGTTRKPASDDADADADGDGDAEGDGNAGVAASQDATDDDGPEDGRESASEPEAGSSAGNNRDDDNDDHAGDEADGGDDDAGNEDTAGKSQ